MPTEYPHIMNIEAASISGNGDKTDTLDLGSTEQFIAKYLVVVSATGTFKLEIIDQAGRAYQNEAVRFGTGATTYYKLIFPTPLIMPSNSTFSFKVTDTSGSSNTVYIQLWGIKVVD